MTHDSWKIVILNRNREFESRIVTAVFNNQFQRLRDFRKAPSPNDLPDPDERGAVQTPKQLHGRKEGKRPTATIKPLLDFKIAQMALKPASRGISRTLGLHCLVPWSVFDMYHPGPP